MYKKTVIVYQHFYNRQSSTKTTNTGDQEPWSCSRTESGSCHFVECSSSICLGARWGRQMGPCSGGDLHLGLHSSARSLGSHRTGKTATISAPCRHWRFPTWCREPWISFWCMCFLTSAPWSLFFFLQDQPICSCVREADLNGNLLLSFPPWSVGSSSSTGFRRLESSK